MASQNDKFRLLARIQEVQFDPVPNGYSKEQVNRVLDNLAHAYEEVERIQARLAEAETRAASAEARLVEARSPSAGSSDAVPPIPTADFDETLRNTLVSAQHTADKMVKGAKDEANRLQSEAELQSNSMLDDAREAAAEMTAEAVSHREQLKAEAEAERLELTTKNQAELDERKSAIEAELKEAHESERASLLAQIADLQSTHDVLQDDIKRFESHLDGRREAIRTAISELSEVVEDPTSLRSVESPEPAEVQQVDEADYGEIEIESKSLNAMSEELVEADEAVSEDGVPEAVVSEEKTPTPDETQTVEAIGSDVGQNRSVPPVPPGADDVVLVEDESDSGGESQGDAEAVLVEKTDSAPADAEESVAEAAQAEPVSNEDPFLAQLRKATNEQPEDGDPITDFLEDESANTTGGGWFGRRK